MSFKTTCTASRKPSSLAESCWEVAPITSHLFTCSQVVAKSLYFLLRENGGVCRVLKKKKQSTYILQANNNIKNTIRSFISESLIALSKFCTWFTSLTLWCSEPVGSALSWRRFQFPWKTTAPHGTAVCAAQPLINPFDNDFYLEDQKSCVLTALRMLGGTGVIKTLS